MSLQQKVILIFSLLVGVFFQSLPLIRSGLYSSLWGLGFWGPTGHDLIWHLTLINHINHPLIIPLPTFSGYNLVNYHPFYDILISLLHRLTSIPISLWVFQLFPLISSFIFLVLSFYLGQRYSGQFKGGIIFLLLNTFSGSLGWLLTLIRFHRLGGESLFWSMQAASNQLNPPYLLSLIYFLILLLFYFYLESRHYHCHVFGLLVLPLLIILTPVTKVYAIIPIFILSFLILFQFFTRRYYFPLILSFLALVISFLLFRIYCPQIKQNLIYRPFWFIDTMIDSPDRLYLPKFSAYRLHLQQTNPYDYRLTVFYLIFFAIFIVGNFGFRLLGLFTLKDCQTQLNRTLFFISIILVAFPTLFVQSHTNWNTIQFLYYALFIFNLFLCRFLSKSSIFWLILITISFIFANYDGYVGYLGSPPPANLPLTEIKALRFFSQLPPGIVLTYPYDNGFKEKATKTPLPLYIYETTSYLSAYTPHLTYLADEMNSANLGLDVTKRRQKLLNFFSGSDIFASRGFLLDNEIKYIYLTGYQRQQAHLDLSYLSLVSVYDDGQTIIYRVNR